MAEPVTSPPHAALPTGVLLAASATKLGAAAGSVILCGSHGGEYPGYLAAVAGVRGIILHDAGIGKDRAGIGALPYLDRLGIPAAAVSSAGCRIGDAEDMARRGEISFTNEAAAALGIAKRLGAVAAAAMMTEARPAHARPQPVSETRSSIETMGRPIVLVDSAALVGPEDRGTIVVTGSHGGLVGGRPEMALQVDAFAAVFNDAGFGCEGAGITRLPALQERGVAAFTVACQSARIGSARSSYEGGVISAVNDRATELGAAAGMVARYVLDGWSAIRDDGVPSI